MTPAEITIGTVLILFFLVMGLLAGVDLWKALFRPPRSLTAFQMMIIASVKRAKD